MNQVTRSRAPALRTAEGWEDRGALLRFKFHPHPTHLWCIGRGRSVRRWPRRCLCLVGFACNGIRYAFPPVQHAAPHASRCFAGFVSFAVMAEMRNISRNMRNQRDTFLGVGPSFYVGDFRHFLRHKRNFFSCLYTVYPFLDDYTVSLCFSVASLVTPIKSYSVSYIRYRNLSFIFIYLV